MEYMEAYESWLSNPKLDEASRAQLEAIKNDPAEIEDRFYRDLDFGTAGLRGIMAAGTNRMNTYTVRKAAKGLSEYILTNEAWARRGVVIAYDSRKRSAQFALEAALTLCARGVRVYLFRTLHSVPQLSFAIRQFDCVAGIVITASHNPAKYSGFKVYWEHGGQINPSQAAEITTYIRQTDPFDDSMVADREAAIASGLLTMLGEDADEEYFESLKSLVINKKLFKFAHELKIVYTPLHGTGNIPVWRILTELDFRKLYIVKAQEDPDGDFPTVESPNPDNPEAFKLAVTLANNREADLIIATDPDADRLGCMVRDNNAEFILLSGNQIGCLLQYYILSQMYAMGTLPKNGFVMRSIVSTNMADAIAQRFGVKSEVVLTGFRYISEKIAQAEGTDEKFLFGFEESNGFLAGDFSRDKDGISAAMLLCEAALWYFGRDMTLYDGLMELFEMFGYYEEKVIAFTLEGVEGAQRIQRAMERLREKGLGQLSDKLSAVTDFSLRRRTVVATGEEQPATLPAADMLLYEMSDGSQICVRPSGTEPKLKLYVTVHSQTQAEALAKSQFLSETVEGLIRGYLE